jgi:dCTP deaminase
MTMATTNNILKDGDHVVIPPGGKLLACTQEEVEMPFDKLGFIQTKGSIARGFLFAHICDGQIDPGYRGKITLELLNASDFYYKLVPGMAIASLFLFNTDEEVDHYDGRYQNSTAPTAMKTKPKGI